MASKVNLQDVFLVESEEQIATLEEGLVALERSPEDDEVVHEVFRAAHTLKGNAGMVGLDGFVEFAHVMESVLDQLRAKVIPVRPEVISALLAATDVTREMLKRVAQGSSPAEAAGYEEVRQRLASLLSAGEPRSAQKAKTSEPKARAPRTYRIGLKLSSSTFELGQEPSLLIRELRDLGELLDVTPHLEALPALEELDPQKLYLEWTLLLRTSAPRSEVEAVFLFVEDPAAIKIEEVAASEKPDPSLADKRIGELLVDEGLIDLADVADALKQQRKVGEILVEAGKVQPEQVERLLEKQEAARRLKAGSSIRVPTDKLDRLVNLVGELVIALAQVSRTARETTSTLQARVNSVEALERIGRDLQEQVMAVRMVPIEETFGRFKRAVRDMAQDHGKRIDLEMSGTETELDKNVIEQLVDPLKHMLRNCIAHGIESPEERRAAGKSETGTITLRAAQREGHILIEIADDGRGVDCDRVLDKARQRQLVPPDAILSREEIIDLIFLPGLSTAEKIDDISGRGVGLDVVRQNVANLRGTVKATSSPDRGTSFVIKLPLTLAIVDGMSLRVGGTTVIVPLLSVKELVAANTAKIVTVESKGELVAVGGEHLPLIHLADVLGHLAPTEHTPAETIVVVESKDRNLGLLVDQVLGVEQTVIKPLDSTFALFSKLDLNYRAPQSVAGATILGDGRVGLVLDVNGIEHVAFGACA